MEPYPFHYSRGLKSDESVNPNFRVMLDELQRMEARLMDMIERQCGSLDCHVLDVQKKTEERLISLKTLRLRWDVQTSRNNLMVFSWWWVTSIASWSMRLGNPQVKQGIFTNPSLGATAGGSNNCRVDLFHRDREYGSNFPNHRIPGTGMSQLGFLHCNIEHSHESSHPRQNHSYAEPIRATQGKLPKIHFPLFNVEDLQLWKSHCESYIEMYGVESTLWVKVASMHLEGLAVRWLQSAERHLH
jgi:hypothetical protein